MDLHGFTGSHHTDRARANKIYGVVTALVTNISEQEGDYKVKLKFPWLAEGSDESAWARIATPMASKGGVGAFFLPEIDDEVLVAFVNGDFDHPVVLGCLWNGVDKPAYSNTDAKSKTDRYQSNDAKFKLKTEAKKNDVRSISTRKKHELVFNDNASEPGVVLASGQKHRIVLNDKGNQPTQIEIYDGKEENYILIDTKNKKITVETKTGDMLLKAKEKIRLEAKVIETDSQQDTKMKVGANFEMQASQNMKLKASGQGNVESSGSMTIKGATVNIN
jgi:uncharacterized protein involved in type VI secretion and phage assembly